MGACCNRAALKLTHHIVGVQQIPTTKLANSSQQIKAGSWVSQGKQNICSFSICATASKCPILSRLYADYAHSDCSSLFFFFLFCSSVLGVPTRAGATRAASAAHALLPGEQPGHRSEPPLCLLQVRQEALNQGNGSRKLGLRVAGLHVFSLKTGKCDIFFSSNAK